MGTYSESADFDDLLYGKSKDYSAEADFLMELNTASQRVMEKLGMSKEGVGHSSIGVGGVTP